MKGFAWWGSAIVVVILAHLAALYHLYRLQEGDPSSHDHSAVSSLALEKERLAAAGVQVLNVTTQFRQTVLFRKGNSGGVTPLVVLLHGFPDNAGTFFHQFGPIAEQGYDVIAPVLRGYEPSSSGMDVGAYTLEEIAGDVLSIIQQEETERPGIKVHLIGHDWGAVLAYLLGAKLPGLFQSIVTLAVPHDAQRGIKALPSQVLNSWYIIFFQLPVLPELWLRAGGSWYGIRWLWRQWSPSWNPDSASLASVIRTFQQQGVIRSALAYYRVNARRLVIEVLRGMLSGSAPTEHVEHDPFAGKVAVPTLALTGAEDGCLDTRVYDITMETTDGTHPLFPRGLEVRRVEGAGHFLHQEKPEEVNDIIVEWLKRWA